MSPQHGDQKQDLIYSTFQLLLNQYLNRIPFRFELSREMPDYCSALYESFKIAAVTKGALRTFIEKQKFLPISADLPFFFFELFLSNFTTIMNGELIWNLKVVDHDSFRSAYAISSYSSREIKEKNL